MLQLVNRPPTRRHSSPNLSTVPFTVRCWPVPSEHLLTKSAVSQVNHQGKPATASPAWSIYTIIELQSTLSYRSLDSPDPMNGQLSGPLGSDYRPFRAETSTASLHISRQNDFGKSKKPNNESNLKISVVLITRWKVFYCLHYYLNLYINLFIRKFIELYYYCFCTFCTNIFIIYSFFRKKKWKINCNKNQEQTQWNLWKHYMNSWYGVKQNRIGAVLPFLALLWHLGRSYGTTKWN